MNKQPTTEKYSAPALSKGLDILEYLADQHQSKKKSDIARALNRSISEIFRMLEVLEQRDYVVFDSVSERYSLTTKLFELGHHFPPIRRLSSVANAPMQALAMEVKQTVHLALLHGGDILIIALVESASDNVLTVRLGAKVPLVEAASGAVLTAFLDLDKTAEINDALENAPEHIGLLYQKNRELVRELGYCSSPSMVIDGVQNISAPIYDHAGDVIAALSIPYIKRLQPNQCISVDETIKALVSTGRDISRLLGGGDHSVL